MGLTCHEIFAYRKRPGGIFELLAFVKELLEKIFVNNCLVISTQQQYDEILALLESLIAEKKGNGWLECLSIEQIEVLHSIVIELLESHEPRRESEFLHLALRKIEDERNWRATIQRRTKFYS